MPPHPPGGRSSSTTTGIARMAASASSCAAMVRSDGRRSVALQPQPRASLRLSVPPLRSAEVRPEHLLTPEELVVRILKDVPRRQLRDGMLAVSPTSPALRWAQQPVQCRPGHLPAVLAQDATAGSAGRRPAAPRPDG